MASRLSDEQLRDSLKEYGEDVGPITPTTRSAWERRLNTLRKTKGILTRKSPINALSSDDSEIENYSSSTQRKKRSSLNRVDSFERTERPSPSSSVSGTGIFKKPTHSPSFTVQGKRTLLEETSYSKKQSLPVRGRKSVAAFDVETSDSDFDTDSTYSISKNARRSRKKHDLSSSETNKISPEAPISSNNFYNLHRRKVTSNSSARNSLQSYSPSFEKLNKDKSEENYHSNGYISNSLSNGELNDDRVEQGSSTNYSHCISWLLLIGVIAFFIIIGVLYVAELQKSSQIASKSYSKFCLGIKEEFCEDLLYFSKELHQVLSSASGAYDCATNSDKIKRNMTVQEARTAMEKSLAHTTFEVDHFDYLFDESVLLFKKFPELGIKCYPNLNEYEYHQSMVEYSHPDISALEATKGTKSLWCRLRLSFQWTITKILLLLSIGFVLFLCYVLTKLWKKQKEAQEKIFYEMVEKVIEYIQQNAEESDNESYKAVVKVRDAIIPPKERKQKLSLWDRVVSFIEENESRISVEYRTINGEDFKVWKWQPMANENEGSRLGKVWQGQAFSNLNKGKNVMCSLSPCLKIRNMFDSEVEYEDGWQVSIQDAILEKCEGNDGIRHIAFDTSTNEGCVYMLCSSSKTAGKAFNDLHGWWFDGKLVTVKYIPLKRYLERFPDSEHCAEPLRPSNNKRLSLSTPFFSSALERS